LLDVQRQKRSNMLRLTSVVNDPNTQTMRFLRQYNALRAAYVAFSTNGEEAGSAFAESSIAANREACNNLHRV
jgi:hypothetical protein